MATKVVLKQHFSVVNSIKPFFTSLRLNVGDCVNVVNISKSSNPKPLF